VIDCGATESTVVKSGTLGRVEASGWCVIHGPEIALDMPAAEGAVYGEYVLGQRVRKALLPKLISGDVRAPDVEKILEGAP